MRYGSEHVKKGDIELQLDNVSGMFLAYTYRIFQGSISRNQFPHELKEFHTVLYSVVKEMDVLFTYCSLDYFGHLAI